MKDKDGNTIKVTPNISNKKTSQTVGNFPLKDGVAHDIMRVASISEDIRNGNIVVNDIRANTQISDSLRSAISTIKGLGIDSNGVPFNYYDNKIDDELYTRRQELKKVNAQLKEAIEQRTNTEELYQKQIQTYNELEEQIKIKHILSRINEDGQRKAIASSEFLDNFKDKSQCKAVVLSIDIRRSTELMLKAREPKLFSEFITELTNLLSACIVGNFGVFDKFTGDGILAFFPTFYSGDNAIIRAMKAAEECHLIFEKHYEVSRYSFNVYIKDVGLGIGVDFGEVTIVNTTNELTVVGIPVVYACRLSGAKAGTTILNQGAFLEIQKNWSSQISFSESEIMIKNEGIAGVFSVEVNPSVYSKLINPDWSTYPDNGIEVSDDLGQKKKMEEADVKKSE